MKTNCNKCNKEIEKIEMYSENRCLECFEKDYEKMTEQEKKPNFNILKANQKEN